MPVLFGGELDDAGLTIVVNVAVLAGAYAVTSYGIVPMMRWALVRMVVQIGDTLRL
ncbi:MAG: hypothetical protein GWN79_00640, partial [Actinobacteria bacterium]|nr:hypothetical protein [Actinomycetota bacterium]NIS28640.1 hypothetical protein [Actinomycetota bacterium]NIU17687.1 hypothetical protein [Actinomycetota bacterium]NIU64095.1 hypothetical protein [Actinomycetota bacterium]NIW25895.1 hypothetical protein [Actinomycetota bacterium]